MQSKIIHFLKSAEGYISGEEISRSLNISRSGIWKHMQELRNLGYEIIAVPHLGYCLQSCPDKLFALEVKENLSTQSFGQKFIHYESTQSTMNEAFQLGLNGAPEGTVVCAEMQKQGRGRMGRTWSSPKGKGVYFSLILRPTLSAMHIPKLTLLVAVALSEVLEEFCGIKSKIKWPNDLLVNGKKITGILTEMRAEVDRIDFLIVGVGLNINNSATQLIENATSVKQVSGKSFNRVEILQHILRKLEDQYVYMKENGFDSVIKGWKERSATLNQNIVFDDGGKIIEGKAVDLAQDGGLLIKCKDGMVVKKMSGDVVEVK